MNKRSLQSENERLKNVISDLKHSLAESNYKLMKQKQEFQNSKLGRVSRDRNILSKVVESCHSCHGKYIKACLIRDEVR
jgi:hypothetical protein